MSGNGIAGHVVLQAQTVAPTTGEAAAKGPRPDIAAGMAAADGRFRLTRLPPGAYVLRIQAPGFAPARVEVEVSEGDLQVDAGEIALETGLAIGGVVRDESGEAITDARVTAQPPGPDAPPPVETRSQADGSFLIAGLAAGIHVVTAAAAGYDGESKLALAGASDVDLVLEEPKTGAVNGLVVDEGGQPVRSFEVRARRHDSPFAETDRGGRTFTTTDGRFVLDRLREESYRIEIAATAELASAVRDEVAVVAGQTTDLWVITLARGGVLRGYVVDAVGAAVRNATVTVAGVGPDAAALPKRSGTTNGIGYFEVQAVPPGNVEAVVTHPSFARSRKRHVARGPEPRPD